MNFTTIFVLFCVPLITSFSSQGISSKIGPQPHNCPSEKELEVADFIKKEAEKCPLDNKG